MGQSCGCWSAIAGGFRGDCGTSEAAASASPNAIQLKTSVVYDAGALFSLSLSLFEFSESSWGLFDSLTPASRWFRHEKRDLCSSIYGIDQILFLSEFVF